MRVGEALKSVLNGLPLTTPKGKDLVLNFHYGDQRELNRWAYIRFRNKALKYPLLWYVITDERKMADGRHRVNSQLILFAKSQSEWLNPDRSNNSYKEVIEPFTELIERTLRRNPFISIMNATHGLEFKDEPNYGVEISSPSDFTTESAKGKKAIATDIVDARVFKIEMLINTNCLIN